MYKARKIEKRRNCMPNLLFSIFAWATQNCKNLSTHTHTHTHTQVKIKNLVNDPLALSGKVGTIAWHVPGGAAIAIEGYPDKFKVENACIQKELGLIVEIVGISRRAIVCVLRKHSLPTPPHTL
jgi:hypothetical protein